MAITAKQLQLAITSLTSLFALLIAADGTSQSVIADLLLRARFLFADGDRFYSECHRQIRQVLKRRSAMPD